MIVATANRTDVIPRTPEQIEGIRMICQECEKWDLLTPGCKLFKCCERRLLTRFIWRLGHCRYRRNLKW